MLQNTDTKMSLAGKKRRSKKVQKNKQVTNSPPENNPASPTKSSKKRDKKLQKPDHVHESKGQSKALRYLKLWYSNKKCKEDQSLEPWKFEKCRQIWLLQNCYSSVRVPPEDFKILLKYMSTINGRMRDGAIGKFCYHHIHSALCPMHCSAATKGVMHVFDQNSRFMQFFLPSSGLVGPNKVCTYRQCLSCRTHRHTT